MAMADVTYFGGASYRFKGIRFRQGETVRVTDAEVISRVQQMQGFSIRLLGDSLFESGKKVVRKVKEEEAPPSKPDPEMDVEDEEESPRTARKKKSF